MPYKNKEDRAAAVRCYRARKKEEQEQIEAGERLQKTIGEILTDTFEFNTIPFRGLVKIIQIDYVLTPKGFYSREAEKIIDDIEIFYGLNMMVAVETLVIDVPAKG